MLTGSLCKWQRRATELDPHWVGSINHHTLEQLPCMCRQYTRMLELKYTQISN